MPDSGMHQKTPIAGEESPVRSEEHTSELQSPCNLVCRLLLEKKNNIAVRELIDGPLYVAVKDGYIVELHRFRALFVIVVSELPATSAEHAAYVAGMIASSSFV